MSDKISVSRNIELQQYLAVLLRRRWIFLLSFLTVVSSTLVASLLMTPVYEATATLQVEERELSIGPQLLTPISPFIGAKTNFIDAEVEIMRSRTDIGASFAHFALRIKDAGPEDAAQRPETVSKK